MRSERKVNHYPPSSATVKDEWSYTSTPLYSFMALKETLHFKLYFYIISSNRVFQSPNKRLYHQYDMNQQDALFSTNLFQ
jgi:hypothetical protein